MNAVQRREEHLKLLANCLNIISAGCAIGAVVTAPVSWLMKTPVAEPFPSAFVIICLVMWCTLHGIGQLVVRRL